jgi:hypothetical protein
MPAGNSGWLYNAYVMNRFFEPEFDFSELSAIRLQQVGNVTLDELVFVYKNKCTRMYDFSQFPKSSAYLFCVGFSSKSRCFFIALDYKNGKYRFLDVKLASENEIEEFWCGRRK